MNAESDKTNYLIDQAMAGDTTAAAELIEVYRPRLRQLVRFRMPPILLSRFDASDVVQEAMIEANERLSEFLEKKPMDFYPWLRKLTWDRLVDLQRRHLGAEKRSICNEVTDASADRMAEGFRASTISPLSKMVRSEMHARLRQCLEDLSDNSREVLMLRFVEQLSIRETSHVLEISETATKSRQLRAIRELSQRLHSAEQG